MPSSQSSATPQTHIALVTGATSGFGEAVARRLVGLGWRVIGNGRRADRLHTLANELGSSHFLPMLADVRNRAEVEAVWQSIPEEWKQIDFLLNNAGLARGMSPFDSGDVTDWEEMIDTNLKGLLYISRVVAPGMRQRGRGHIINVGSTAGKETYPNGNVYCATKHAVDALTRCMRLDLMGSGVKVGAIHPGAAETEFSLVRFHGDEARASAIYDGFQPLTAEDIADTVLFMLEAPAHVNIADVVMMSTAQASARDIARIG